jgi:hypothetical protein
MNCVTVIPEGKHYNTISSFNKEQTWDSIMRSNRLLKRTANKNSMMMTEEMQDLGVGGQLQGYLLHK